jgi:hypothetical protein
MSPGFPQPATRDVVAAGGGAGVDLHLEVISSARVLVGLFPGRRQQSGE